MSQQQPLPTLVDVEEAFTGFAALPLEEIQRRTQAAAVPAEVLAQAQAKLQPHLLH